MNKQEAKAVQTEVGDAIEAIYAKHNLRIKSLSASYDDASLRLTISAISTDDASNAVEWDKYAPSFGLPTGAVGKTIQTPRGGYRITGIAVGRSRFPVRVTDLSDGSAKLLPADAVARLLA